MVAVERLEDDLDLKLAVGGGAGSVGVSVVLGLGARALVKFVNGGSLSFEGVVHWFGKN